MKKIIKLLAALLVVLVGISTVGTMKLAEESEEATINEQNATETGEETSGGAAVQTTAEKKISGTITITATGDCTLGNNMDQSYDSSFNAYYDSYGPDYFFSDFKDLFSQDDFTVINLECVLTNLEEHVDQTYCLKGKPEYTAIMSGSSVEGCTLGNNHSQDYGEQSLYDTEDALDAAGLVYAFNDTIGYYTTDEGLTIGLVSVDVLVNIDRMEQYLADDIAQLKSENCDLIVVCVHWGDEKAYYPNYYQKTLSHTLVDEGADLVIGNHPHVLEGIELYNGKIICYSLGNFCFGGNKNPSEKNSAVYQQTFTYKDGVLQPDLDVRIIPCRISTASGYNDFHPIPVEGSQKQTIIDNMNTYSASFSSVHFSDDGVLITESNE